MNKILQEVALQKCNQLLEEHEREKQALRGHPQHRNAHLPELPDRLLRVSANLLTCQGRAQRPRIRRCGDRNRKATSEERVGSKGCAGYVAGAGEDEAPLRESITAKN